MQGTGCDTLLFPESGQNIIWVPKELWHSVHIPTDLAFPVFFLILLTPNSLLHFFSALFIFFSCCASSATWHFLVSCFPTHAEPGWRFLCDVREHAGLLGKSTLCGRSVHIMVLLSLPQLFGWPGSMFSSHTA